MKVKEVMSEFVETSTIDETLAAIGCRMLDRDCGLVPLLDQHGGMVGVLTDRDICIAGSTLGRPLSGIRAGELPLKEVYACGPEDDVRAALKAMGEHGVRRLVVMDAGGEPLGVLSLDDAAVAAEPLSKGGGLTPADVGNALRSICLSNLSRPARK